VNDATTGIAIVDWALGLLAPPWGYLIVFGFTVSENIFILGTFTPGETVVVAAAFVASTGDLSLLGVWFVAVVGGVVGSNIGYFLGRRGGREAFLRIGDRFHMSEKRIEAAEEYFYKHGSPTIFVARFAAGVKNLVPMIAGASRMHLGWFELYTVLGAMAQTTLLVAIGYFVGANIDRALQIVSQVGIVGLVLFVVVIALALFGRRRFVSARDERLVEEIEAEDAEEQGAEGILDEEPFGGMDEYEP
jgi:membrane protein DedA with SNARE-associated domain